MSGISRRSFTTLTAGAAASLALPLRVPQVVGASAATPHSVAFDEYSLIVDGRRLVLWSGEFHPFRLPSPSLWADVLQKMAANGYNAVSIYVAWNYHSPSPGVYDFTGVRDLDALLTAAADAGLFVTVRPGPYINAEVDAGGFPGWLTATAGTARSNDSTYLSHVDEWLTAVNAIVSKHQYTDGGGTVLLYQIENEYASHLTDGIGAAYMAHLYAKVRADGITVPLFHNDKGRNADWVPGSFSTGGETGRYLYAFDGYPSPSSTPPDWGYYGTVGAAASPATPGFEAEFSGGWFDCWGGAEFAGAGYAGARASRNAVFERQFYLTNLANGIKLQNVYMTFGGTSWGWLPAPVVYTSYDYGAAIDEARNQTSKLVPMKQIGLMLESVPDLAQLDAAAAVAASSSTIKTYHLANPATGAHFYFLRNTSGASVSAVTLPVTTSAGTLTVPAAGAGMSFPGKDMKVLATGIQLGHRTLLYSTAQPMYQATVGAQDVAVFTGRTGDPVEVALPASAVPTVTVLDGAATYVYDATSRRLTVDATLSGLIRVLVNFGDGGLPLLLLLADDAAMASLWRQTTAAGPLLVRGPALVRTAQAEGVVLRLTGDTEVASDLEVWAPTRVRVVLWNGAAVRMSTSSSGSLNAAAGLPGPGDVALPALTDWRYADESPESAPEFDDSGWRTADKSTSAGITPVPTGQPVLFADDYGFHYGDVWYRGHYSGAAGTTAVSLTYSSGTQGLLMAWLDGTPLGTHRQPVPTLAQATTQNWTATATFAIPTQAQGQGAHVLSVLVRPMAHSEDGGANDAHKTARGLTAVTFTGADPALTWLIQGGSTTDDPVRGPLNTGGLYGERNGWHLPTCTNRGGSAGPAGSADSADSADAHWLPATLPSADTFQGVRWYRTSFTFAPPPGVDASVGLTLTDDPSRAYRVQIFLNGWNLGQYINDVGPQHTFVLPNGILRAHDPNVLALAVLADGTTPVGPGTVALTLLGAAAGGVTGGGSTLVRTDAARSWAGQ